VNRFCGRSGAGSVPAHGLAPQNLSSDKHVDVCVDSGEDRGSTPLASTPRLSRLSRSQSQLRGGRFSIVLFNGAADQTAISRPYPSDCRSPWADHRLVGSFAAKRWPALGQCPKSAPVNPHRSAGPAELPTKVSRAQQKRKQSQKERIAARPDCVIRCATL